MFKRVIYSILLISLSLEVCAQNIERDLGNFTEVKTYRGVETVIIPSTRNQVVISGHSKEKVRFDIIENRLEIRLPLDHIWSEDNTLVKVYGSTIQTIDANEGSVVEVEGILKEDSTVFRAQEGASIIAEIQATTNDVKAVSGGSISLRGKVRSQVVEVNTGGQFYGRDLRSKETEIGVSTAGKGEVYATQYCKSTATLGGVIKIFGKPERIDRKTSLGGKIF